MSFRAALNTSTGGVNVADNPSEPGTINNTEPPAAKNPFEKGSLDFPKLLFAGLYIPAMLWSSSVIEALLILMKDLGLDGFLTLFS
ncbi:MAG: hypothetical protein GY765_24600 [bacterium]|nr:hypothetical protein [bacterium]